MITEREQRVIDFLKLYDKMHRAGLGPSARQIADGIAEQTPPIKISIDTVRYILKKLEERGIVRHGESRHSNNAEWFVVRGSLD